jgi:hypothetical protein
MLDRVAQQGAPHRSWIARTTNRHSIECVAFARASRRGATQIMLSASTDCPSVSAGSSSDAHHRLPKVLPSTVMVGAFTPRRNVCPISDLSIVSG